MDWQITFLLFTAACSGHIFWQLGKKYGISSTLDYLKADGQIDFDEDWNLILDIGGKFCYNYTINFK
mgnify:FL=1